MLSPGKIALLRVAKSQLGLSDEDYRAELERHGGTSSTKELDDHGLDAVLNRFKQLGFVATRQSRSFGDRHGMASAAQVDLIRSLWSEVTDEGGERDLNTWLQRFGVSALRFVTRQKAAKVIAALRAWKAREASRGKDH